MNKRWRNKFDFVEEEGRDEIYQRYDRRQCKQKGFFRQRLLNFRVFSFNRQVVRSFTEHFNLMVIFQIIFAVLVTFGCDKLDLVYDIHTSLFISPIVFPLAFSINTDFQRKEKVLDDLALFKSSAMMWTFCMRDWREACAFDDHYLKVVRNKIQGLMLHLRMYLFTEKQSDRKCIVRVIYEDLSDANQINEKVRCSEMTSNAPLVSRTVHFLNMMCLSFERLRVIREYRSPRSIRSFTKVLIFFLPILLSPYYLHLGRKTNNLWSPYYISVMVAFVFSALQGVQDKLDDPFDGMSEDDIKLESLEEWAFHNLEATAHRTYKVGRFQISSNPLQAAANCHSNTDQTDFTKNGAQIPFKQGNVYRHNMMMMNGTQHRTPVQLRMPLGAEGGDNFELHPYASVLNNIKGNTTILRGGQVKNRYKSYDDLSSHASTRDMNTSELSHYSRVSSADGKVTTNNQQPGNGREAMQQTLSENGFSRNSSIGHLQSLHHLANTFSPISIDLPAADSPLLDFTESDVPLSDVKSYSLNMILHQENGKSRSRSGSLRSNGFVHSRSTSSHSPQQTETVEAKPVFFIGDSSAPINPPLKATRRPSPFLRSHSLPDTNEFKSVEYNNPINREIDQVYSTSETRLPRFPQTKNYTEKSRFTVRRNQISFSTEPLLNLSRCPESDDESCFDDDDVIRNANLHDVIPLQNEHSHKRSDDVSNFPGRNLSNGSVNSLEKSPVQNGESPVRKELRESHSHGNDNKELSFEMSPEHASLFNSKKIFHDTTF